MSRKLAASAHKRAVELEASHPLTYAEDGESKERIEELSNLLALGQDCIRQLLDEVFRPVGDPRPFSCVRDVCLQMEFGLETTRGYERDCICILREATLDRLANEVRSQELKVDVLSQLALIFDNNPERLPTYALICSQIKARMRNAAEMYWDRTERHIEEPDE